MRLYFVANARMPGEKAHGIHIAKMCEAFIEARADVTLVVPSRAKGSLKEFYGLRAEVPTVRLPVPNFYNNGRVGYLVSSLIFMFGSLVYLWWKFLLGERFVIYTVDLDNYSSSHLALAPAPLYSEMHGGKPKSMAQKLLFARAKGIIPTNPITRDGLMKKFLHSHARYTVEPNGVDEAMFPPMERRAAREALGLPPDGFLVMYTGRFWDWKGLEIIPAIAAQTPEVQWYLVGGMSEEFERVVHMPLPHNMHFAGERPYVEMPRWFAAADALMVLGTKRDTQSFYWTSPMKLFEYLLSGRPIIASKTPAIKTIVSEKEVFFYEPDDVADVVRVVHYIRTNPTVAALRAKEARTLGKRYSWRGRAERILSFIEHS